MHSAHFRNLSLPGITGRLLLLSLNTRSSPSGNTFSVSGFHFCPKGAKAKAVSDGQPQIMKHLPSLVPESSDSDLGPSIAALRKSLNMQQQACCSELEHYGTRMTSAALSRWENGSNLPGCYQLLALSHALSQEGRVDRFSASADSQDPALQLSEHAGRALSDFLVHRDAKETARRRRSLVPFPLADNYASAGTGYPLDEDSFSSILLPAGSIPERAAFVVRISGDSMEPRFHDGQLVFVEKTAHLYDGEIGVFSLDGEGYIKQYRESLVSPEEDDDFAEDGMMCRKVSLVSCNPRYTPIRVSSGAYFMVLGRVL